MLILSIIFLLSSNAVILRRDKSILYARVAITILISCFILCANSYYSQFHVANLGLLGNFYEIIFNVYKQLTIFYGKNVLCLLLLAWNIFTTCIIVFNFKHRKTESKGFIKKLTLLLSNMKTLFNILKTKPGLILVSLIFLVLTVNIINSFFWFIFELNHDNILENLLRLYSIFPLVTIIYSYSVYYVLFGKRINIKQATKNITFTRFICIVFSFGIFIYSGVSSMIFTSVLGVFGKVFSSAPDVIYGFIKLHPITNGLFTKLTYLKANHVNIRFSDSYSNNSIFQGKKEFLYKTANLSKKPYLSHFIASKSSFNCLPVKSSPVLIKGPIMQSALKKLYFSNPLQLKTGIASSLGKVNIVKNDTGSHGFICPNKVGIGKQYFFVSTNKDLVTLIENSCLVRKTLENSEKVSLPIKSHYDLGSLENYLSVKKPLYNYEIVRLPIKANQDLASLGYFSLESVDVQLSYCNQLTNGKLNHYFAEPMKDLSGKVDKDITNVIWNRNYLNETANYLKDQNVTVFVLDGIQSDNLAKVDDIITQDSMISYLDKIPSDTKLTYKSFLSSLEKKMSEIILSVNSIHQYQVRNNIETYNYLGSKLLFKKDLLNNNIKTGLDNLLEKLELSLDGFLRDFIRLEVPETEIAYFNPAITWIYVNIGQNYPIYTCMDILNRAKELASELEEQDALYLEDEVSYVRSTTVLFSLNEERLGFPISIIEKGYDDSTPTSPIDLEDSESLHEQVPTISINNLNSGYSNTQVEPGINPLDTETINNSIPKVLEESGNDLSSVKKKIELYLDVLDLLINLDNPSAVINSHISNEYKVLLHDLLKNQNEYSEKWAKRPYPDLGTIRNGLRLHITIYKEINDLITQYKLEKIFITFFTKEKNILEGYLPIFNSDFRVDWGDHVKDPQCRFYIGKLRYPEANIFQTSGEVIIGLVKKRVKELTTIVNKNK